MSIRKTTIRVSFPRRTGSWGEAIRMETLFLIMEYEYNEDDSSQRTSINPS